MQELHQRHVADLLDVTQLVGPTAFNGSCRQKNSVQSSSLYFDRLYRFGRCPFDGLARDQPAALNLCRYSRRFRFDAGERLDARRRPTEAGGDRDGSRFTGGACSFLRRSMNQRPAGPGGLSVL